MKKFMLTLFLVASLIAVPVRADNYARTDPQVRVMLTNSYKNQWGSSHLTQSAADMDWTKRPFQSTYNMFMAFSYVYVSSPMDQCGISGWSNHCTSACGTCVNSISGGHHKNIYKNFYKIKNDISSSGYDNMVTLVSGNLCSENNHYTDPNSGTLGLGDVNGKYVIARQNASMTQTTRVRILQHELSHNYGCSHHTSGNTSKCIMNGGYNSDSLYANDVWCSTCQSEFNAPVVP